MDIFLGIIIPFLGTTLGSSLVFLLKDKLNNKIQKILLGFASGVMIAASIWSLIIPSIDMSEHLAIKWLPAAIGFLAGIAFLLILDTFIPHLHLNESKPEGVKSNLKKTTMLLFAVTLHNIPEGMAVGVVLAGAYSGNTTLTVAGALTLAIGIAIQNFPEGSVVSFPLLKQGFSKRKAFMYGFISGIFELLGTLVTLLFTNFVVAILPYMLSIAAGAMMYVIVVELLPESTDKSRLNVIGFLIGFIINQYLGIELNIGVIYMFITYFKNIFEPINRLLENIEVVEEAHKEL